MVRRPTDERLAVFAVAFAFFCFALAVATAWNGLLTLVWHPGIHLEQTSVAVNYARRGLLTPFSQAKQDLLHLPPLYSWVTYVAVRLTGWTEAGRLVSVLSGVSTIPVLYATLRELDVERDVRLGALVFLATSPLFVLLGGAIMQEALMILCSTVAMYTFARYVGTGEERYLLLTAVPVFLSTFAKWPGVFILVPIGLFLLWDERWRVFRHWQAYAVAVVPVSLSLGWFLYISSVSMSPPSGDIANRLVINVRTTPVETVVRLGRYWLTRFPATHLLFAVVGLSALGLDNRRDVFVVAWLAGGLSYVLVFLSGAVFHDHYSALMLPPLAILAAQGLRKLSTVLEDRTPLSRDRLVPAVWILLFVGMLVGLGALTTAVSPETRYAVDRDTPDGYVVSGLGNRDILLVISPDGAHRSYSQEVDAVAQFVNEQDTSHVGLIPREAMPVYYRLGGDLSRIEIYSNRPGEPGLPSGKLTNDPSPAEVVVAPKRSRWDGTLSGYEQAREFDRFYVLVRADSAIDSNTSRSHVRDTR
jgi:hypothetical protein